MLKIRVNKRERISKVQS